MGIAKALGKRLEQPGPPQARRGSGALDSETRMDVYRCAVESPGLGIGEIARRVGKGDTSVRWHLRRLVKADLLFEERRAETAGEGGASGRSVCMHKGCSVAVMPRGVYPAPALEFLALANGPDGGILSAAGSAPGSKLSELSLRAGAERPSVARRVARLCVLGYLRCVRDGRSQRIFLGEGAVQGKAVLKSGARATRGRLVQILQSEVPGLRAVATRAKRVVAECPWGVETFNLPFE